MFRCVHGTVPAYLAESFNRAADDESRRRLRSGASSALLVPTTRRRTLGDHAFPRVEQSASHADITVVTANVYTAAQDTIV